MPTSRDVARVAGVSQSTVSYVMSGRRPISAAVRKRVEDAIEQLTYQPNAGARALASQRTQVIGLVVPFGASADTSSLLPFIEVITSGVREHDFDVLLVTADEGPAGLRRLEGRSLCDAIVLMEIADGDPRIEVAAALKVPVVLIGVPEDPRGLPCVDVDFEAAARMAVEELARTGHQRVVVLGRSPETIERRINYVRRVRDSAVEAARSSGVDLDLVETVEPTGEGAREAVERAVAGDTRRLGLVVTSAATVQPVLRALAERSLTPGHDVSLIALCTDAAAEVARPMVTNVSLEPRDVSRRAVETLFQLLDRDRTTPSPGVQLVTPRLTRRETTIGAP
jgi:DNA-binding LacI/PurR family transcriptional regulator